MFSNGRLPVEPTDEQRWAINKIREFNYRRLFGLSKIDMDNEPYEDFIINNEIDRLYDERTRREADKLKK